MDRVGQYTIGRGRYTMNSGVDIPCVDIPDKGGSIYHG